MQVNHETQSILDYCLVLLYDYAILPMACIDNDTLVQLFIRNSLKVPSLTRVRQYFQEHLACKSAIYEFHGGRVRDWARFHNRLKKRPGYKKLIPFTRLEQDDIRDIRYVKYRILSYEVENNINGIQTFDFFINKKFIAMSPAIQDELKMDNLERNSEFNANTPPRLALRDILPSVSKTPECFCYVP